MGPTVFTDPVITWVAATMLLGIVAALALARDVRKRSRAAKSRSRTRLAHIQQKQARSRPRNGPTRLVGPFSYWVSTIPQEGP